jgi:FkbM family methyltransferase
MNVQEWAQLIVKRAVHPVIIELGAHHGVDTVPIYDACQTPPSYLAVEADPRNLPVFKKTISARKIELVHAAIADHVGHIDFHQCEGNYDASGSIREPKEHLTCFPHITFEYTVVVPCLTLDWLTDRHGLTDEIDLIWCDIQGAEGDMIAGGQRTLERTRYMVIEADRLEMYAGQATRATIEGLLPDFQVIDEWPVDANVLFKNRNLA